MEHFTVTSDRLAGHEPGDEITTRSLGDANVDALIEGGHLRLKRAETAKKSEEKTGTTPDTTEKSKGSE